MAELKMDEFVKNVGQKVAEDIKQKYIERAVLDKIRAEIERLHYHPKLDFIKNDEVVDMALEIFDKYTK